jgi:low affinity Fe/Cu permease
LRFLLFCFVNSSCDVNVLICAFLLQVKATDNRAIQDQLQEKVRCTIICFFSCKFNSVTMTVSSYHLFEFVVLPDK